MTVADPKSYGEGDHASITGCVLAAAEPAKANAPNPNKPTIAAKTPTTRALLRAPKHDIQLHPDPKRAAALQAA